MINNPLLYLLVILHVFNIACFSAHKEATLFMLNTEAYNSICNQLFLITIFKIGTSYVTIEDIIVIMHSIMCCFIVSTNN